MADEQLVQLRTLIHGTLRFTADFERHQNEGAPAEGSAAARELAEEASFAGPWFDEPVTAATSLAGMLVALAADHLGTLADVVEPPVPIWADLTILRGVLDASARAWWLYEPGDVKTRLARGMTEWAYSYHRAHQVLQVSNPKDTSRLDRISSMVQAAGLYGMRVLDKAKPPAFERGRPDTRDLLEDMLGDFGVLAWQWTSGVTHGVAFGIMTRADGAPSDRHATGLVARARRRSLGDVYGVAALGLKAHQAAWDRRREHYGWDPRDWHEWTRHVDNTLRPALRSMPPTPQRGT